MTIVLLRLRCVRTVEPLASSRGLPVEPRDELSEERQEREGLALLRSLAGGDAIVCTHGGSPWDEITGGRYRKGETVLFDDALEALDVIPPP